MLAVTDGAETWPAIFCAGMRRSLSVSELKSYGGSLMPHGEGSSEQATSRCAMC